MKDFKKDLVWCFAFSHNYGHLVGIYLSDEQIKGVQDLLTQDEPACGAVGRYKNVPVFRKSDIHLALNDLVETDEGMTIEVFR